MKLVELTLWGSEFLQSTFVNYVKIWALVTVSRIMCSITQERLKSEVNLYSSHYDNIAITYLALKSLSFIIKNPQELHFVYMLLLTIWNACNNLWSIYFYFLNLSVLFSEIAIISSEIFRLLFSTSSIKWLTNCKY